jgi:uncharacterized protein YfbU (UPF0304 family)
MDKNTRLILVNQYEILKHLDPGNAKSYEEKQEILRSGYQIYYSDLDPSISENEGLSHEASTIVLDVLSMYWVLTKYQRQHPEDTEIASHPWARFLGFDGNEGTESPLMGFAQFLIATQGKFADVDLSNGFDSHMPTAAKYVKMLYLYEAKIEGRGMAGFEGLTRDDYLAILNA